MVIGGAHSNNTQELVKTCSQFCARVHHVQTAADLREEWFCEADIIGITAGTSTPDAVIDGVEQRLRDYAARMAVQFNQTRKAQEPAWHLAESA